MIDEITPLSILGMGSLPFQEGEDKSRRLFEDWDLPFWPQYPARSPKENFVFQFLGSFPGLQVSEEPQFYESTYRREYGEYRKRLERAFRELHFLPFEPAAEWALGYSQMKKFLEANPFPGKRMIKLQVTGPGTVWNSFFRSHTGPSHGKEIQDDLFRTLTAAGLAQIKRFRSFQKEPLIFIDESLPMDTSDALAAMIHAFKNSGARVGIHTCSKFSEETFQNLEFDLFHFDLHAFLEEDTSLGKFLLTHLKKGGWVVWGLIPTQAGKDFPPCDSSGFFLHRIANLIEGEFSVEAVLARSLLAPACGTGLLTPLQDRRIFESLRLTAEGLRKTVRKTKLIS